MENSDIDESFDEASPAPSCDTRTRSHGDILRQLIRRADRYRRPPCACALGKACGNNNTLLHIGHGPFHCRGDAITPPRDDQPPRVTRNRSIAFSPPPFASGVRCVGMIRRGDISKSKARARSGTKKTEFSKSLSCQQINHVAHRDRENRQRQTFHCNSEAD